MVIEYVERGQIMVYNPKTLEFVSPITSSLFFVQTEEQKRSFLKTKHANISTISFRVSSTVVPSAARNF